MMYLDKQLSAFRGFLDEKYQRTEENFLLPV